MKTIRQFYMHLLDNGTLTQGLAAQLLIIFSIALFFSMFISIPQVNACLLLILDFCITLTVAADFKKRGYEWTMRRPRFLEGFIVMYLLGFLFTFLFIASSIPKYQENMKS